jgi:CTP:molybdopterin cytidylyltransferase MocA
MANDVSDMPTRTAGLILAAGSGTRFGGGKMLAHVNGRPMLQHVLDLVAAAELDPVVVVIGEDANEIEEAIHWRRGKRIRNPDPGRGMSSSVALGLARFGGGVTRVLVLLGDQPFLRLDQLLAVVRAGDATDRPIVVPRYSDGNPGNPVLLKRTAWPLVQQLTGDRGMSQLFGADPDLVAHVDVSGANPDIDTQEDLSRA